MDFEKYSYQKLASKLASYILPNQCVRVIVFFSSCDPGRDRANLILLKQYGVVPEEINIYKGEINMHILSDLNDFDGLTVMIDSVWISDHLQKNNINLNEHHFLMSQIPEKYYHLINHQTEKISRYCQFDQHENTGGYIYISGFSVLLPGTESNLLPETEFLPWYLAINNKPSLNQVLRQPELNLYMQQVTEVKPQINDLDELLDQMRERESGYDV